MSGVGLRYTRAIMTVCPLCEHDQIQGAECEVCGLRLDAPARASAPVAPLEGLEPTLQPAVEAAVAVEQLVELEPTRLDGELGVPEPLAGADLDLEPTRAPPVDVAAEPLAGIERIGEGIPDDGPTPLPALNACRYCRTPALPGERRCSRCGMRLSDLEARGTGRDSPAEDAPLLCGCGAVVRGAVCPACGGRAPEPPAG